MMSSRLKFGILLALTVAALVATGGYWVATAPQRAKNKQAPLMVDAAALDFGTTWKQKEFRWSVKIRNTGDHNIHITDFVTACGCLGVEPKSLDVPAGGDATVTLVLDLTKPSAEQEDSEGYSEWSIQLAPRVAEGEGRPPVWVVHGRVAEPFRLSQDSFVFDDNLVRGSQPPSQTALVTGRVPLETLTADYDKEKFAVKISPVKDTAEPTYSLTVTPLLEKLGAGPFREVITLETPASNAQTIFRQQVVVQGVVREDIQAVPDCLVFGAHPVGTTVTDTIVLRAASKTGFTVESVDFSTGEEGTAEPKETSDDGKGFLISKRVTRVGSQKGKVVFSLRKDNGTVSAVAVSFTYVGISSE
jgi:hypothetical protein